MKWLWPRIADQKDAEGCALQAALWATFVCVLTGGVSITALLLKHPVMGVTGWGLVDAILFGIAAWRIYKFSLLWAILNFAFYSWEAYIKLSSGQKFNILILLIFTGAVSGIRGTLFLRKLRHQVVIRHSITDSVVTGGTDTIIPGGLV